MQQGDEKNTSFSLKKRPIDLFSKIEYSSYLHSQGHVIMHLKIHNQKFSIESEIKTFYQKN